MPRSARIDILIGSSLICCDLFEVDTEWLSLRQ